MLEGYGPGGATAMASAINLSVSNLAQAPAEMITVLHKPAEPTAEPMMVFWQPVTTAQPAKQPRNMLLLAVVLRRPAQNPANKL